MVFHTSELINDWNLYKIVQCYRKDISNCLDLRIFLPKTPLPLLIAACSVNSNSDLTNHSISNYFSS